MANRPRVFNFASVTDVAESAANTETVVATLPNVTSEFPGQTVAFAVVLSVLCGTTVTGMTVRIRRDSLTGTQVGEDNANRGNVVASQVSVLAYAAQDVRGGEFSGSYVVTIQGTGEGTAATCQSQAVTATVA